MASVKFKKITRFIGNGEFYLNFFHNLKAYQKLDRWPVIICGCPRSGTSLLMSILDSHPQLHVIPFETAVLQHRPLARRLFKNKTLHFAFTRLQLLGYLFSNRIKDTAALWGEKTPLNILNVDEISEMYRGRIRYINIVRDGRDVVASYHPRFGYMVMPSLWVKCIEETRRLTGRENFMVLRYEDLVDNAGAELSKIKNFLALDTEFDTGSWLEKTGIKGHAQSPVNNNLGISPILTDINKNSVGNWEKSASPYVKEFIASETCMELNRSLGYK